MRLNARLGTSGLICSLLASALAGACGGDPDSGAEAGNSGGASGGLTGSGADTASGGSIVVAGTGAGPANGGSGAQQDLVINLDAQEITVSGEPVSIELEVEYADGSKPNGVVWSVDDTTIGSIDQDGVFTANGWVAGTVTITVEVGGQSASVEITVVVDVKENPGDVDDGTQDTLSEGGSGGPNDVGPDGDFAYLYPYDETVFPRGLSAPVLQLGGSAADATLVVLEVGDFKYSAYYADSDPPRITLPEQAWKGATLSAKGDDWLTVSVTKISGDDVTGPVSQRHRIAQGSLKGIIYYNTYASPLAGNEGAIMRIKPGESADVLQAGCTVCHSVSSQGNVLVSGVAWGGGNPTNSASYALSADGQATELDLDEDGRKYSFGGLTPDGSLMMVSAVANGPKPRGLSSDYASRLIDPASGEDVTAKGWAYTNALTPAFSHDGKQIAFSQGGDDAGAHILTLMDFDEGEVEFSGARDVVDIGSKVVAWPSFLPDGAGIVYHEGDNFDTGNNDDEKRANVRLVDLGDDDTVSKLERLNGMLENGDFYLPFGEDEEADLNYEPTVLPVPVGGFYWVLFTSRRAYGNTLSPGGTDGGDDAWTGTVTASNGEPISFRKKIWVAAIDLDYSGKVDPSHPAFYLPGQELEAGNMRAFAALEPCKDDGQSCESGAECCGGFCRETGKDDDGNPILECVPPPVNECSQEDESCETASDCCNSTYLCINGRCAQPAEPPPK
jgi:hypothetical protein